MGIALMNFVLLNLDPLSDFLCAGWQIFGSKGHKNSPCIQRERGLTMGVSYVRTEKPRRSRAGLFISATIVARE